MFEEKCGRKMRGGGDSLSVAEYVVVLSGYELGLLSFCLLSGSEMGAGQGEGQVGESLP